MPELKLAKLPDRTPVKITITVTPDLNAALNQYAQAYRATYGETESVAELIPYMLGSFLAGDRGFAKARKGEGRPPAGRKKHASGMFLGPNALSPSEGQTQHKRRVTPSPPPTPPTED